MIGSTEAAAITDALTDALRKVNHGGRVAPRSAAKAALGHLRRLDVDDRLAAVGLRRGQICATCGQPPERTHAQDHLRELVDGVYEVGFDTEPVCGFMPGDLVEVNDAEPWMATVIDVDGGCVRIREVGAQAGGDGLVRPRGAILDSSVVARRIEMLSAVPRS